MTYCTALLKSEKHCSSQAKYALREYNLYVCKTHALAQANLKMNTNYQSIEEIPNLHVLGQCIPDNNIDEILENIKRVHGYTLKVVASDKFKMYYEFTVIDSDEYKYILRIVKSPAYIDRFIEASSIYANLLPTLSVPICIPIVSYVQADTNRTCLVKGWEYFRWYYELSLIGYPLIMNNHTKLINRLVDLIEYSHEQRIVHGSIELRSLVQLKPKRISTTIFESLHNAMFWKGRYGQTVEYDTPIDFEIKFDLILCAKRMNQKLHPYRYDDFESLLYLTLQLLDRDLPWAELTSHVEIYIEKNAFLQKLINQGEAPLSTIAQIIIDSHYDDRPNYTILREQFKVLSEQFNT